MRAFVDNDAHGFLCLQVAQPAVSSNGTSGKARIAVLGASGYTGEEVVRLLALHPNFEVTVLTGETQAGKVGSARLTHHVPATAVFDDVTFI